MTALRAKAVALSSGGGRQWSAAEVERALHSAAIASAAGGGEGGSGKKRKR